MKHLFKSRNKGFALVVTLSLMIVLVVVAVALLGLASISLRSTGQGEAVNIARSNARLGMMIALGELQKSLGHDQSVSAPASSVIENAAQPRLTGAWASWRWAPTSNSTPPYGEKSSKFRRWLISAPSDTATQNFGFAADAPPAAGDINSVSLVGPRTDAQNVSTSVNATKVSISRNGRSGGKYAWVVFDESVKAPIHLEDPAPALAAAVEAASRTSPSRVRADIVAPKLTGLIRPKNLISLDTGVINSGPGAVEEMRSRFHDFTTSSVGLLTDTANGGLKSDLTSIFEDESATLPGVGPDHPLYFSAADGAPTWGYLRNHYRKYKNVTLGNGGAPSYRVLANSDLKIDTSAVRGVNPAPTSERLLPVLAKCQIVFSLVSHHAHKENRIRFYDSCGTPAAGNERFALPHFVYEPVFTLHNPYDVTLTLDRLRVRVWDPPVKFRFDKRVKNPIRPLEVDGFRPFRADDSGSTFFTIAQFQGDTAADPNARKAFTFLLTDGTPAASGSSLTLLPGEVKVFSARVEPNFTWEMEVTRPGTFFEWNGGLNFGNVDGRTRNQFGLEAVPDWNTSAGLQTDHLAGNRSNDTLYGFERQPPSHAVGDREGNGHVAMRLEDEIRVQSKPEAITGIPFRIEILAGQNPATLDRDQSTWAAKAGEDLVRSYQITIPTDPGDIATQIGESASSFPITRVFSAGDILQKFNEQGKGLKTPFAILEVSARTTKDPLTDSKPWLYNNHIVDGAQQNHLSVGPSHQSYDVRFREMSNSYNSFPGIEIDPDTYRGFFGADSYQGEGGSSFIVRARVPVAPLASLGELISANIVASARLPRVVNPFGNARAHPLLRVDRVNRSLTGVGNILDHSYLLNDTLWDRYYFSTVADYQEGLFAGNSAARDRLGVLNGIFSGSQPPLNSRIVALTGGAESTSQKLNGMSSTERARKMASYIGIRGAFNLNSTSVDAWQAVLSSLRDRAVTGWKNELQPNRDRTPFPRATLPVAGAAEGMGDLSSVVGKNVRWAGYRSLNDDQIRRLAQEIVKEITSRSIQDKAPPLSVGEFVNRRLASSDSLDIQSGILQVAIDASGVNETNRTMDSRTISYTAGKRNTGTANTAAMSGFTGDGAPSSLTQGDLMTALAPIATVRGDTFKIRCYGEALAADQTTVTARAWCEAVVQRTPDFVDPADPPEAEMSSLNNMNKTFGRRFEIVSFRWLSDNEI